MRRTAILSALLLAACSGSADKSPASGGTAPAIPEKAAKAARLAKELEANPDDADAILQRHGMTQQQFEDLMYEIAADETLSEAYARARAR